MRLKFIVKYLGGYGDIMLGVKLYWIFKSKGYDVEIAFDGCEESKLPYGLSKICPYTFYKKRDKSCLEIGVCNSFRIITFLEYGQGTQKEDIKYGKIKTSFWGYGYPIIPVPEDNLEMIHALGLTEGKYIFAHWRSIDFIYFMENINVLYPDVRTIVIPVKTAIEDMCGCVKENIMQIGFISELKAIKTYTYKDIICTDYEYDGITIKRLIANWNDIYTIEKHSHYLMGTTGDQSFTEAISLGKIPIHDSIKHYNIYDISSYTKRKYDYFDRIYANDKVYIPTEEFVEYHQDIISASLTLAEKNKLDPDEIVRDLRKLLTNSQGKFVYINTDSTLVELDHDIEDPRYMADVYVEYIKKEVENPNNLTEV